MDDMEQYTETTDRLAWIVSALKQMDKEGLLTRVEQSALATLEAAHQRRVEVMD